MRIIIEADPLCPRCKHLIESLRKMGIDPIVKYVDRYDRSIQDNIERLLDIAPILGKRKIRQFASLRRFPMVILEKNDGRRLVIAGYDPEKSEIFINNILKWLESD